MRNRSLRYGTAPSTLALTSLAAPTPHATSTSTPSATTPSCSTAQPPVTRRLQDGDVAGALLGDALSHPDPPRRRER